MCALLGIAKATTMICVRCAVDDAIARAYYPGRDDVYLVELLTPREKQKDGDISPFSNLLGMLSVLTTLCVTIYCISSSMRPRNMV